MEKIKSIEEFARKCKDEGLRSMDLELYLDKKPLSRFNPMRIFDSAYCEIGAKLKATGTNGEGKAESYEETVYNEKIGLLQWQFTYVPSNASEEAKFWSWLNDVTDVKGLQKLVFEKAEEWKDAMKKYGNDVSLIEEDLSVARERSG